MLRNLIRRSGMLALVLALALAGTAPAAALGFDFGGRNLDGWHAVWNWITDVFGWADEGAGNSGGLSTVYEGEGSGIDPWGQPQPTAIPVCPTCELGPGAS